VPVPPCHRAVMEEHLSYRVRMSAEVREWLAALPGEDEQTARLVGSAVTVLFAGGMLGPPLVTPLESLLRTEHPGSALDHSYQRQLELLQVVRRSVADLATERRRLGEGDLGQEPLARRYEELVAEERQAILSSERLMARVDAFRTRKGAVKAGYTAALADQRLREALAEPDAPGLEPARAAADELLRTAADLEHQLGAAPETVRELRLETVDLRLLFAAESPDTATLLVAGTADDWAEWYEEAVPLAWAELQKDDFVAYDKATFLAEYFPGEETEIEDAAARLIELNRGL
jgi:hypothetical protein